MCVVNYKIYLCTKINSARQKKKYEGFIIESFNFDQIKKYLFTMFPYFMDADEYDSDVILNYISKYNTANKIYLSLFIIFFILAILTFIFID